MQKCLLLTACAFLGLVKIARAENSIDLRPIQHKFVELGVKEERHHIKDQIELEKFWRRFSNEPVPKSVNLDKSDLLIFLMGTQSSGGYFTKIESAEKSNKTANADTTVQVLLCHPPEDEPQTAEITSPYAVKVIPNLQGKVVWKTSTQKTGTQRCK